MRDFESKVVLPKGGGNLKCYARHYVLLEGKEALKVTRTNAPIPGGKILIGRYFHENVHPGIHWAAKESELPMIFDAGCSMLEIIYVPGLPDKFLDASCSSTLAGTPGQFEHPLSC